MLQKQWRFALTISYRLIELVAHSAMSLICSVFLVMVLQLGCVGENSLVNIKGHE